MRFVKVAVMVIISSALALAQLANPRCSTAFGNMGGWARIMSGATIRVCQYTATGEPCTPAVTLWRSLTDSSNAGSTVTADAQGNYCYYTTQSIVLEQISAPGYTTASKYVLLVGQMQAGNGITISGTTISAGTQPVDVGVTYNGVPTSSLVLVRHPFPFAVTIPSGCTNSKFVFDTSPTSTWVASLQKNNVEFGTVSCSTASPSVCTFTCATATSFALGDVLKLVAPAGADATAAGFGGTIYGTRAGGPY